MCKKNSRKSNWMRQKRSLQIANLHHWIYLEIFAIENERRQKSYLSNWLNEYNSDLIFICNFLFTQLEKFFFLLIVYFIVVWSTPATTTTTKKCIHTQNKTKQNKQSLTIHHRWFNVPKKKHHNNNNNKKLLFFLHRREHTFDCGVRLFHREKTKTQNSGKNKNVIVMKTCIEREIDRQSAME